MMMQVSVVKTLLLFSLLVVLALVATTTTKSDTLESVVPVRVP